MRIVATISTSLNLVPLALPFEYSFSFKRKRGEKDFWFTPTGKGKIWTGAVATEDVGNITEDEYNSLVKAMKEAKADCLYNDTGHHTDVQTVYTIFGAYIRKLTNMNKILVAMNEEFEARKHYEDWVK